MSLSFLIVSLGLCFLMLFSLYRVLFGPTVLDRLVGVNAIGSQHLQRRFLSRTGQGVCVFAQKQRAGKA